MTIIEIDVDLSAAARAMQAFGRRSISTLAEKLGALNEGQTKQRFARKVSPDGAAWAPLKPSTIARRRKGSKSILTDKGLLMGSIRHKTSGFTSTVFQDTSVAPYGPFHQRGTSKMVARPFMGVGDADMVQFRQVVEAYVLGAML